MKIDATKRIAREDIQGAPDWIDALLTPLNQSIERLTQAAQGQLELSNNQLAQIVTQKCTDGVEIVIKNPFKNSLRPIGAVPLRTSSPYSIDAVHFENKTDSDIGLTCKFALPNGYLFLNRNANQSIADVTDTAIIWTTSQSTSASAPLSWSSATNPSRITAGVAGKYLFTYTMAFEANAAGQRLSWLAKNGSFAATATRFGTFWALPLPADPWVVSGSAIIEMAVNDYVELYCRQNTGVALNAIGNSPQEVQIMAHPLSFNGYSADVTFVLYGG